MNCYENKLLWKIKTMIYRILGRESDAEKARKKFIKYYRNTTDPEIREMIDYIRETGRFEMINKHLLHDYQKLRPMISFDEEREMYYVKDDVGNIYWPESYERQKIEHQYRGLKLEQDEYSPHRYLTDEDYKYLQEAREQGMNIISFDCGAMEGIFTMSIIDYLDKAYILECEKEWVNALSASFKNYESKIDIINKYVSDISDEIFVRLDDVWGGGKKRKKQFSCGKNGCRGSGDAGAQRHEKDVA